MQLEQAKTLAEKLFHQHGLSEWSFAFDRARRRFGCCWYERQSITISRVLTQINDSATVHDVLLHEIAHAILGPGYGHGKQWQEKVQELGGRPERTCCPEKTTLAPAPYSATCPVCQKVFPAYRKPTRKKACGLCCRNHNRGRYHRRYRLNYEKNPLKNTLQTASLKRKETV